MSDQFAVFKQQNQSVGIGSARTNMAYHYRGGGGKAHTRTSDNDNSFTRGTQNESNEHSIETSAH